MQDNESKNKIIEKLHNSQENWGNYVSLNQRIRQLSKIQIAHIFSQELNLEKLWTEDEKFCRTVKANILDGGSITGKQGGVYKHITYFI